MQDQGPLPWVLEEGVEDGASGPLTPFNPLKRPNSMPQNINKI